MKLFGGSDSRRAERWGLGAACVLMLAGFVGKAVIYGQPVWVGVLYFVVFCVLVLAIGAVIAFFSGQGG